MTRYTYYPGPVGRWHPCEPPAGQGKGKLWPPKSKSHYKRINMVDKGILLKDGPLDGSHVSGGWPKKGIVKLCSYLLAEAGGYYRLHSSPIKNKIIHEYRWESLPDA